MAKISKPAQKVIDKARSNRDADGAYWLDTTDVATLVRDRLRREFPAVKFSVRSSKYSMGSSVDAHWTDGPTRKEVDAILNEYAFGGFDGMIDMSYSCSQWLLPDGSMMVAETSGTVGSMGTVEAESTDCPVPGAVLVKGGAKYVSGHRDTSDEHDIAVAAKVLERFAGEGTCVPLTDRGRVEDIRVDIGNGYSEYLRTLMHREEQGMYC